MKALNGVITSKGQITIPAYIRNKLALSSGSKLEFIVQEDSFIVVPIHKSVRNLRGILPKPNVTLTIEEMKEIIKGSYDRD